MRTKNPDVPVTAVFIAAVGDDGGLAVVVEEIAGGGGGDGGDGTSPRDRSLSLSDPFVLAICSVPFKKGPFCVRFERSFL